MTLMMMALAMVLGFTQCKKEQPVLQDDTDGVRITLTLDGGDNSKVVVNPTGGGTYATVTFEKDDIIFVGNNGHFCGILTHDGSKFTGTINEDNGELSTSDYLHFYFMGNTVARVPEGMSITDQTSKYPVISYDHSQEFYAGAGSYTAKLKNYCAIVKFKTPDIDADITITGMNNIVGVNFALNNAADGTGVDHNPYSPNKVGTGDITLHKVSNTERWAVLLEQDEVTDAMAYATGYATASAFTMPAIGNNQYLTNGGAGYAITMEAVPVDYVFSVSGETKVHFSRGNLQAVFADAGTSTCTWKFADHQYDYVGNATANTAVGDNQVSTAGTVDLFGWVGESSSLAAYGINNSFNLFDYGEVNDGLKIDWGTLTIGGGEGHSWRTLTNDEWVYLFNTRNNMTVNSTPNARFTKATITTPSEATVNGVIIFPDNYVGGTPSGVTWGSINLINPATTTTTCTAAGWASLETLGCVFLPAAGSRLVIEGTISEAGESGFYWSSSHGEGIGLAYDVVFSSTFFQTDVTYNRFNGHSVRLVY